MSTNHIQRLARTNGHHNRSRAHFSRAVRFLRSALVALAAVTAAGYC